MTSNSNLGTKEGNLKGEGTPPVRHLLITPSEILRVRSQQAFGSLSFSLAYYWYRAKADKGERALRDKEREGAS